MPVLLQLAPTTARASVVEPATPRSVVGPGVAEVIRALEERAREGQLHHPAVYVDLFCGAGGSDMGAAEAFAQIAAAVAADQKRKVRCIVVNHDPKAIASHKLNHPDSEHVEDPVEKIKPRDVLGLDDITILWWSAPCTHFSKARGGKPRSQQNRATPDMGLAWIEEGRPLIAIQENVWDITTWGPLTKKGKVIKAKRGLYFRRHIKRWEQLGYRVEWRPMNAADHGDPTTRMRFIAIGVRLDVLGDAEIPWPTPTHSENGTVPGTAPWRDAAGIIDWDEDPGRSISPRSRARPVVKNTRRRIAHGFDLKGAHWRNVSAAIRRNQVPIPIERALDGLSPEEGQRLLEELLGERVAFTLGQQGGAVPRGTGRPVATIPTAGFLRLIQASFVLPPLGWHHRDGMANKPRELKRPIQTITAGRGGGRLVSTSVLFPHFGERKGQAPRVHDLRKPFPTHTSQGAGWLARAMLVTYYRYGKAQGLKEPMPTATTHDRFALVWASLALRHMVIDILMRMLTPRELARGMSFPDWYRFVGTKSDIVKQIGNAVPIRLACAIVHACARFLNWERLITIATGGAAA